MALTGSASPVALNRCGAPLALNHDYSAALAGAFT